MRINTKQICEYTGGSILVHPIDPSALACGISWDSRSVVQGDIYVALPGERVDGHDFISAALRAGAAIILVTEKPDAATCLLAEEMGAAIIEVSNTSAAITDIARRWRSSLHGHVLAVTGSSGKTTTKNLIRDVLKASFTVVSTEGNQNNELGVPKTLLSADPETEVVIVEMGMRGLGQIAELCEFTRPDMGLITNIGEGHIELLGSKENIARAKAELLASLPEGVGKAFLNRGDEYSPFISEVAELEKRRISLTWFDGSSEAAARREADRVIAQEAADTADESCWGAWADQIELDSQGRPNFLLHINDASARCRVPLRGIHNVQNACAAASVAASLGMDIETIVAALENAEPERGRQEILTTREGLTVINDTYNANPDSMRAALMMFAAYEVSGRRVAVLGDMGELGDFAQACHEGIGELVADLLVDRLICVGDLSLHIARAAEEAGMDSDKIQYVKSIPEVLVELESYLLPEDAVLVKASRFMELERVVGGLVN